MRFRTVRTLFFCSCGTDHQSFNPRQTPTRARRGGLDWPGRSPNPRCGAATTIIYNAVMPKRQIGVEVLIEDHFWSESQGRYVYSYHCPACGQLKLVPELGIRRCDCGSWLIVTNQR